MACDVNIGMCADGSKARKEINKTKKTTKGFGKSAGKSFLQIAKVASIAGASILALTKTVKFVKGSITSFNDFELAVSKLDNVIRATGGAAGITTNEMLKMADELQNLTTFSNTAAIEAQGILATFREIGRDVFPEALKIGADMSEMFGQELQQSMVQLGIALNDPVRGFTRLQRIGITFSDQQKEMIKTLQASGDIMGAQNIILAELRAQFGGAAEAARNTFGGSVKSLKNEISDLQRALGFFITEGTKPLIPAISNIVTSTTAWLNAKKDLKEAYETLGKVATEELEKISQAEVEAGIRSISTEIAKLEPRIKILQSNIMSLDLEQKKTLTTYISLQAELNRYLAELSLEVTLTDELKEQYGLLGGERDKAINGAIGLASATNAEGNELGRTKGKVKDLVTEYTAGYFPALQTMTDMTTMFTDSVRENSQALADNQTSLKITTEDMDELGFTAEKTSAIFTDAWTSSLQSAFETTDDLGTKMKNLVKELFASLLTAIGQQMAVASAAFFLTAQFGKGAAAAALSALAFAGAAAIRSLQQGGVVPGRGGGDVTPALLEPGEVVLSKETVSRNQGMITAMEGGLGGVPALNIFFGTELFFSTVNDGIENGEIRITQDNIIPA